MDSLFYLFIYLFIHFLSVKSELWTGKKRDSIDLDSLLFYLFIFFLSNLSCGLVRNWDSVAVDSLLFYIFIFFLSNLSCGLVRKWDSIAVDSLLYLFIHFLSVKSELWTSKKLGQHCCGFAVLFIYLFIHFLSVKSELWTGKKRDSIDLDSLQFYLFIFFLSNLSCGLVRRVFSY